jgi:8-oxo-dGTP pyrophosphatase MutT (NUDIX family)
MIVRDRQVLLGRRAPYRRICPDTWDLIGGHVEPDETLEQALTRELGEEIGVTPTVFRQIAMIDFTEEAGEEVHFHLFRISAFEGQPRLANDEHTALRWFSLDEAISLPDLASPRYRPIFLAEAEETAPDAR